MLHRHVSTVAQKDKLLYRARFITTLNTNEEVVVSVVVIVWFIRRKKRRETRANGGPHVLFSTRADRARQPP